MFEQRVIGVDPGLSRCGVAVLDGPGHRATVVESDVVRTPPAAPLGDRLRAIHNRIEQMVRIAEPASLSVERVFINAQARTGTGAMQVVGLVHLIGAAAGLTVTEYTPSQVKAAVTGVGDADKDQVTYMVMRLLKLSLAPTPADRADAMAVALCHLSQPGYLGEQVGGSSGASRVAELAGSTGISPRLAAAMQAAGPGLAAVQRPVRTVAEQSRTVAAAAEGNQAP